MIGCSQKGIFTLLDDESKLQLPSVHNFTQNVHTTWRLNATLSIAKKMTQTEGFAIQHFAGKVEYDTVRKNNYIFSLIIFCFHIIIRSIQFFQSQFCDKNSENINELIVNLSVNALNPIEIVQFEPNKKQTESSSFKCQLNALLDELKKMYSVHYFRILYYKILLYNN